MIMLWLVESWKMTVAMAPWLLLGLLVSGILHTFLPMHWIRHHLADTGWKGTLKAALVGTPLPLCSCGVIPVAKWLRKEGASRNSTLSFLVATPETGVDSILATIAMLGPVFGVLRPSIAIVSGIAIGLLASRLLRKEQDQIDACAPLPNPLRIVKRSGMQKIVEVFQYGFGELFEDVAKWLLVGLLAGGAISAFVPAHWVSDAGAWGHWGSYVLVIALGVPLYVCATGSIPIAAALMAKGIAPGAALVFLVVGPATNVATIAFVQGNFGRKTLLLYLGSIVSVALLAGISLDLLAPHLNVASLAHIHHQESSTIDLALGTFLALLFVPFLFKRARVLIPQKSFPQGESMSSETLLVPGMTCQNCVRHVDKAAKSIPGVEGVQIDLTTHQVVVQGIFDLQALKKKLDEEGYPST